MHKKHIRVKDSRVLVLGLTFKENSPDLRNTKVIDIIYELIEHEAKVDSYDPWVDVDEANQKYGINSITEPEKNAYDAIIIAVAHQQFIEMGADQIRAFGKKLHLLYDLKYVLAADQADLRL